MCLKVKGEGQAGNRGIHLGSTDIEIIVDVLAIDETHRENGAEDEECWGS